MRSSIGKIKFVAALPVLCLLVACEPKPETGKSPYEDTMEALEAGEIKPGPIQHPGISDGLDARIREFAPVFTEVYPITHQEWLDGFQRDAVPENEVAIWEQMASAYTGFLEANNVDAAARKEAFGLLLYRSSSADVEPLFSDLKQLTVEQAKDVIARYDAVPKPITIKNAN